MTNKSILKSRVEARLRTILGEVTRAQLAHAPGEALPLPTVERPKKAEHGDFATNIALAVSRKLGRKPLELANELAERLRNDPFFLKVEVAGPGFLNLTLRDSVFHHALEDILASGRSHGRAPSGTGERVCLEFVSANPTGPLHLAHGRGAIAGDVLARVLEARGHRVVCEYYVNDAGNQVTLLTRSVLAKAKSLPDPEGGYGANAYVSELAQEVSRACPELLEQAASGDAKAFDALSRRLVAWMLRGYGTERGIAGTLRALQIRHDVWSSEAALHADGRVDRAIETLRAGGWLKPEGDALVFRSTELGDDKDRVVYKSDGGHTYFASDIAYHQDKLDRGFDRLIDVWGADHHGYIARVRAALTALVRKAPPAPPVDAAHETAATPPAAPPAGGKATGPKAASVKPAMAKQAEHFEVLLVQMVRLLKDGVEYRMGKRLGNFITIDEVLEEIDEATGVPGSGRDALRYYFSSRRTDAQIDIDVEIAKKQSLDNPVYYLQYGHARLCNVLAVAEREMGIFEADLPVDAAGLAGVQHKDELAMITMLADFPEVVDEAARLREPHRIVGWLQNLAQTFQSYYTRTKHDDPILPKKSERGDTSLRTRNDGADFARIRARLAWVRALRDVYAGGLDLLGISAPVRMERKAEDAENDEAPSTSTE